MAALVTTIFALGFLLVWIDMMLLLVLMLRRKITMFETSIPRWAVYFPGGITTWIIRGRK